MTTDSILAVGRGYCPAYDADYDVLLTLTEERIEELTRLCQRCDQLKLEIDRLYSIKVWAQDIQAVLLTPAGHEWIQEFHDADYWDQCWITLPEHMYSEVQRAESVRQMDLRLDAQTMQVTPTDIRWDAHLKYSGERIITPHFYPNEGL